MKTLTRTGIALAAILSSGLYAQDTLIGIYSGTYVSPTRKGEKTNGLSLKIEKVENGVVSGSAINESASNCRGTVAVQGKHENNKLILRSIDRTNEGCSIDLNLAAEGGKLVGTMGNKAYPVTLSK